MKNSYLFLLLLVVSTSFSQQIDSLFAISYKTLPNPNSPYSTNGMVRVAKFNPTVGFLANVGLGTNTVGGSFTVDGGSVNQTTNTFNLIGSNSFMTFDVTTGNFLQQMPITSFATQGSTYFGQVRFNNSNTTLYGLARVSVTGQPVSTYLARLVTSTGNLVQLSQTPLADISVVTGTVIDPIDMVFYYCSPTKFVGLDLYNGSVYSSPNFVYGNPEYYGFGNIAFNCTNREIYGLIRGKYASEDAPTPTGYIYYLKLGKINPNTGVVTEISTVNLPTTAFSVGASATVDESNGIYYFVGTGQVIYGVSLATGAVVSSAPATFEDGNTVFFINDYNNCINRTAERLDPALSNNQDFTADAFSIYPNPTSKTITISTSNAVERVEIYDSNGRIVKTTFNQSEIDVEALQSGVYFLKIFGDTMVGNQKFVKQ